MFSQRDPFFWLLQSWLWSVGLIGTPFVYVLERYFFGSMGRDFVSSHLLGKIVIKYYYSLSLQQPKGREVEDDDVFVFNEDFVAPLFRIKVLWFSAHLDVFWLQILNFASYFSLWHLLKCWRTSIMVTGVQRICCICSKNLSHTYIFFILLKYLEYSGDGYLQVRKKICKYV